VLETTVTRQAYAKLNVFLRVQGRRADGYHELESLVLPLSLADVVRVSPSGGLKVDVHGD
jgi:4-diphosphocytidyl-2-C-methyl-D-erythritol kinase